MFLAAVLMSELAAGLAAPGAVINEIMYHPRQERDDLQYIELYNCGSTAVDLSNWRLKKAVTFVFPAQTKLAAGAYIVVCRNRQAFAKAYGTEVPVLGDFAGRLKHGGEKLELRNERDEVVEAVHYLDKDPWPAGPDGYRPSLERICPTAPASDPQNWAASDWSLTEEFSGTPGERNSSFSTNLPPVISKVEFSEPEPAREMAVAARVTSSSPLKSVSLLYTPARPTSTGKEMELPMERTAPGSDVFIGKIPAQGSNVLLRFRLKAVDQAGDIRFQPAPNEPQPAYSVGTFQNTNNAQIAFAYIFKVAAAASAASAGNGREAPGRISAAGPLRRNGPGNTGRGRPVNRFQQTGGAATPSQESERLHAFVYVPPVPGKIKIYDFVHARPRSGGYKVHFNKNQPFNGMTGINLIFEGPARWILSEFLAYEVYHGAEVPAPLSDHLRVWMNGRPLGYQLMIEQPNKSFLARNGRDTGGNLYKVLWYGSGVIGQHEKKLSATAGHDDMLKLLEGLNGTSGAAQWKFIEEHFNTAEFASYYAVNMCIQNWDGYHNNYYTYHDLGGTGKWEIYPWDEDKTWGDYDGAAAAHDWYEMPLTMGMNGDPNRGGAWWRPGSWFAGPLLANPEFRKRYLARLAALCQNVFTEEKLLPAVNALEKRLEPEITFRAWVNRGNVAQYLSELHADIQSFRNQLKHRRAFILSHLDK